MNLTRILTYAGLCAALLIPNTAFAQREKILSEFADPSMEYRPRVWWHWMNGNVTKDGIRKDLLWMKSAGVGGVQVFDAGLDVPTIVENRLSYMSEGWKEAFNYAARLADSLGMEFAIAGSGGWSDTGGPWVTNEQAQKTLKWKTMEVEGGTLVDLTLPAPDPVAGKYLSHSFFGTRRPEYDFYRDIAVIAARIPSYDVPMEEMGVVITASDGTPTAALHDEDLNKVCKVTPGDGRNAWIQFEFPSPVTIRSYFTAKKDDYKAYPGRYWEVSDDGVVFRRIDAVIPNLEIPFVTLDIPETKGRFFRYVDGNPGKDLNLTELRVYASARVNIDTEKAAFFINCGVRDFFPTPEYADATPLDDVVDITPFSKDGRIHWEAPEGRWRIYRFGYTLRGRRNNPASPEATGLETDKYSAKVTTDYFRTYLDKYNSATGGKVGKVLTHLMLDSYEAGCQTWTDNMEEEFRNRRSYELRKWLPALAGQILVSSEETDRFLQDWKRTLGEMMAENHYDALDPLLEEYGLKRYTEFHESGRAFPADGMSVKKNADIPMGAVWTRPDGLADQKYMADIRESASVAHIYGQNTVAAEAFTTDGYSTGPDGTQLSWNMTPERMKGTADMAMASGLNLFVIHCSVHQPVDNKLPGTSLGQYGLWFQRHETWAHEASAWTGYLARSGYLLRQGKFVSDLAYLASETVNVADRFNVEAPLIPEGFAYDFVNRDVVCSGKFGYKALLIDPETRYMSIEMLRGIESLAERGVIIAGSEPEQSLGRSDDNEEEFKTLVKSIWHSGRSNVVPFDTISQALAASGCVPDVVFGASGNNAAEGSCTTGNDSDVSGKGFGFVHRHLNDGELYFITSSQESPVTVPVSFNVYGRKPLVLRADSGTVEEIAYRMENGRTSVSLDLNRHDACFVLFGDETSVSSLELPAPVISDEIGLMGPWDVAFRSSVPAPEPIALDTLIPLSEHKSDDVRHFSGTAVYSSEFRLGRTAKNVLAGRGGQVVLSLGAVFNMARVRVNGIDCGLAWKQPFELDITNAVRRGVNKIEIEVTDSWANRLIGDAQSGAKPVTWVEPNLYGPSSPLCPSGLTGPVKVVIFKN